MFKKKILITSILLLTIIITGVAANNINTVKSATTDIMVRVAVYDDTKNNSVNDKAEIWFKGYGSWWLKPELEFGATVEKLGKKPSGIKQTLYFYPESRDGKEIKIPYKMTNEMNPDGSVRDTINISIKDKEIVVDGLPIKEATGDYEVKYKR
ncbi:MAG: hypothetical protein ACOCRX_10795 [Candidatus Woesearchaeota archaeon]